MTDGKRKRSTPADVATWAAQRAGGMSNREIAERAGVDEGTVRYRLDGKRPRAVATATTATSSPASPAVASAAATHAPTPADEPLDEPPAEEAMTPAQFAAWLTTEIRTHQRTARRAAAQGDTIGAQRASKLAATLAAQIARVQARDDGDGETVRVRLDDMRAAADRGRAKLHDYLERVRLGKS